MKKLYFVVIQFVRPFVRQQFNSILSIISFILLFLANFVDITIKIRVLFSSDHKFFERFFFNSSKNSFVRTYLGHFNVPTRFKYLSGKMFWHFSKRIMLFLQPKNLEETRSYLRQALYN